MITSRSPMVKKILILKNFFSFIWKIWGWIWFLEIAKYVESNMVNNTRLSSWVKSVYDKIQSIPENFFCVTSKLVTKREFSNHIIIAITMASQGDYLKWKYSFAYKSSDFS